MWWIVLLAALVVALVAGWITGRRCHPRDVTQHAHNEKGRRGRLHWELRRRHLRVKLECICDDETSGSRRQQGAVRTTVSETMLADTQGKG